MKELCKLLELLVGRNSNNVTKGPSVLIHGKAKGNFVPGELFTKYLETMHQIAEKLLKIQH